MRYALRYIPGTTYGDAFPSWRWGFRASREAAEAVRLRCPSVAQIEVCEVQT